MRLYEWTHIQYDWCPYENIRPHELYKNKFPSHYSVLFPFSSFSKLMHTHTHILRANAT